MSLLPNETDDEIRGLKWQLMTAEARIRDLETLIEQYEEKLKLARLITWREGDEGPSPLDSPRATASTDPSPTGEPKL